MCKEKYRQQNQDGRPEIAPLHFSGSLAKTVLNSLSANIAILDEYGVILETNQAWRNYATANKMEGSDDSIGVNYLALCDATTGKETSMRATSPPASDLSSRERQRNFYMITPVMDRMVVTISI